jgi:hypothetical protein
MGDTVSSPEFLMLINSMKFENRALLGYYATSRANPLPTFRDNVSVPSSWVKKSKKKKIFLDFLALEDGTDTLSRKVGK